MIEGRDAHQTSNPLKAVEDNVREIVMPEELDDLEPFVGQWRMTPSLLRMRVMHRCAHHL
jgi:hypothetical protein